MYRGNSGFPKCRACNQEILVEPFLPLPPLQRQIFDILYEAYQKDPNKSFKGRELDARLGRRGRSIYTVRGTLANLRLVLRVTPWVISTHNIQLIYNSRSPSAALYLNLKALATRVAERSK